MWIIIIADVKFPVQSLIWNEHSGVVASSRLPCCWQWDPWSQVLRSGWWLSFQLQKSLGISGPAWRHGPPSSARADLEWELT